MTPNLSQKWIGAVPSACDHCKTSIFTAFSDIKTRIGGSWAILCDNCVANLTDGKYGIGIGQRYVRQADGSYLKVA